MVKKNNGDIIWNNDIPVISLYKHKSTYMSIKIVYYTEVIDNWGRSESSRDAEKIRSVLTTPEDWNDDMSFEGDDGQIYFLDDLLGKEVSTSDGETFIVPNDLI